MIVGNSEYSSHPEEAIGNTPTDPANNTAYTFHFYAGSHAMGAGEYGGRKSFRDRVDAAINAGLTVFVTEWGTTNADGGSSDRKIYTSESKQWLDYFDVKKISWANWSVHHKDEASAIFAGNESMATNPNSWNYNGLSESGKYVYDRLQKHAETATWRNSSTNNNGGNSGNNGGAATVENDVLDNFEDGDNVGFTGGVWYAYNDEGSGAASSFTNASDTNGYVVVLPADNGSAFMAGMTGVKLNQADYEYEPYVALGFNFNEDEKAPYKDLEKCSEFSYKYKGAAHNFKVQSTRVEDYAYHYMKVPASTEWKEITISWAELSQDAWGADIFVIAEEKGSVNQLAWEIKGSTEPDDQIPNPNYLYVDDLRCTGLNISLALKGVNTLPSAVRISLAGRTLNVVAQNKSLTHVNIFDLTGHKVLSQQVYGAGAIDVSALSQGNYIVRVEQGSAHKSAKINIK